MEEWRYQRPATTINFGNSLKLPHQSFTITSMTRLCSNFGCHSLKKQITFLDQVKLDASLGIPPAGFPVERALSTRIWHRNMLRKCWTITIMTKSCTARFWTVSTSTTPPDSEGRFLSPDQVKLDASLDIPPAWFPVERASVRSMDPGSGGRTPVSLGSGEGEGSS